MSKEDEVKELRLALQLKCHIKRVGMCQSGVNNCAFVKVCKGGLRSGEETKNTTAKED